MTAYYDSVARKHVNLVLAGLEDKTQEELAAMGILPISSSPALPYNKYTEQVVYGEMTCSDQVCWQSVSVEPIPASLQPAMLERAKADKSAAITAEYSRRMAVITEGVPLEEQLSWPDQRLEAQAWLQANNITDVELLALYREQGVDAVKFRMLNDIPRPYIFQLAINRGVDKTLQSVKVVNKVLLFRLYGGPVTGIRQGLEDKIKAATTVDEVLAVEWPKDQLLTY